MDMTMIDITCINCNAKVRENRRKWTRNKLSNNDEIRLRIVSFDNDDELWSVL